MNGSWPKAASTVVKGQEAWSRVPERTARKTETEREKRRTKSGKRKGINNGICPLRVLSKWLKERYYDYAIMQGPSARADPGGEAPTTSLPRSYDHYK